MKKTTLLLAFIGLFSIALIFILNKQEDSKNKTSFNTPRNFKSIKNNLNSIKFNFTPSYMTVKKDTLSLLNYNLQKVAFLNNKGEVIDSIGQGRGDAPNENNRIYHYDYNDEFFYTFDVSKYSIAKSNRKTNGLVKYYLDTLRINHAQRITEDKFIISYRDYKTNINFGILNIKDSNLESLDELNNSFKKAQNSWWIYDGFFDKSEEDNSLFYITYFSNDIIKTDSHGNLLYKTKLIHNTPLIKLTKQGEMLYPSENSNESVLDTALDSKYLYVLSNVSDRTKIENKEKRVVDCYNIDAGDYSHSYIIPNINDEILPLEIEVLGDTLFTMYEESIESYKI